VKLPVGQQKYSLILVEKTVIASYNSSSAHHLAAYRA